MLTVNDFLIYMKLGCERDYDWALDFVSGANISPLKVDTQFHRHCNKVLETILSADREECNRYLGLMRESKRVMVNNLWENKATIIPKIETLYDKLCRKIFGKTIATSAIVVYNDGAAILTSEKEVPAKLVQIALVMSYVMGIRIRIDSNIVIDNEILRPFCQYYYYVGDDCVQFFTTLKEEYLEARTKFLCPVLQKSPHTPEAKRAVKLFAKEVKFSRLIHK